MPLLANFRETVGVKSKVTKQKHSVDEDTGNTYSFSEDNGSRDGDRPLSPVYEDQCNATLKIVLHIFDDPSIEMARKSIVATVDGKLEGAAIIPL